MSESGNMRARSRFFTRAAKIMCALAVWSFASAAAPPGTLRPINHVFVIVLENQDYSSIYSPGTRAPYLGLELPKIGVLLTNYYAIGHNSLDNYVAMISGQPPAPQTSEDCSTFTEFVKSGPDTSLGTAVGDGCVYPAGVMTLANQLEQHGLTWRGYMEDMGNDPAREASTCAHPAIGGPGVPKATRTDAYAYRHNPFIYFHGIIDNQANCDANVVNFDGLANNLADEHATPNFVFITPNVCNDGHDSPCKDGRPGGLVSADLWLQTWVPKIVASPAFRKDGLLIITFDESDDDDSACCQEPPGSQGQPPGVNGPGGGKVGAILISRFIKPGTTSDISINHYGLLRGIEDVFGLPYLGYAGAPDLATFTPLLDAGSSVRP
ncbi:MAG TPA: alkaline phosphatase family protein [Rhizomicrobium sp.]|nr:alkaline phosphatase family protein [Rhizomicrobium sp.]